MQDLIAGGLRTKLEIGGADDPEEREADSVANSVTGDGRAPCACGGRCEQCAGGAAAGGGAIRRKPAEGRGGGRAPSAVAVAFAGSGRPMDMATRRHFEPSFGTSLSHVRLHDDTRTASMAATIGARAYAAGNDIGFARGQLSPNTPSGRALLAHELTHVVMGHGGVRRVGMDDGLSDAEIEQQLELGREIAAKKAKHRAWEKAVDLDFHSNLDRQSKTITDERERIDLAVLSQRLALLDASDKGEGWLSTALKDQGYSGPDLQTVRRQWGEAVLAAEGLSLSDKAEGPDSAARIDALETIPPFYEALKALSAAIEQAHKSRYDADVAAAQAEYDRELEVYNAGVKADKASYGPIGEPGERSFRTAMAIRRGSPPIKQKVPAPPPGISAIIDEAIKRLYAADSATTWTGVTNDVRGFGASLSKLVAATMPASSSMRQNVEHLEALQSRLVDFESKYNKVWRIPAVFYPLDKIGKAKDKDGNEVDAPEAIPWQFYLTNTALENRHMVIKTGGEWTLTDLTSGKAYKNTASASDADIERLQKGEIVDPPTSLFDELNTSIRFPKGRLYYTMPSGRRYVLETTEPITLTQFLEGLGLALAAIAITASIVATGGASAPLAVAFYAGLGAAGVGIAATLSDLHDKEVHGILTAADTDQAMVSIGLDVLSAMTMGLGKIASAPGAAARFGSRFVILKNVTQAARAATLAGDIYQAYAVTSSFIKQFQAIDAQTGLTEEERRRMRSQLIRRAMLTGAMMTIAIKADVSDLRAGGVLHVSGVDSDGTLVAGRRAGADAEPSPGAPHAAGAARAAPHGEVSATVHGEAQRAGAGLTVGRQSHALAAGGSGRTRDFYFCSDLCMPLILRLQPIVDVLPRNHPERAIFQDLLSRARGARQRLRAGKLTQQQADDIAGQISADIERHSKQSWLFAAFMNENPAWLAANRDIVRRELARTVGRNIPSLETQRQRQEASRASGRDPVEEPGTLSPLQTDILGSLGIRSAEKASTGLQPIRFDVGNFSHTNAEALVPGLPRGLHSEVTLTLPDGTVGRADRVRFIYDTDGDRIGAHVYEIKPNTPENVAQGEAQAADYMAGLRAEIEANLRDKGKAIPMTAPDGGPLYSGQVMTYDFDQMMAMMRAIRGSRRDAAQMAQYEAIARQVFANVAAAHP